MDHKPHKPQTSSLNGKVCGGLWFMRHQESSWASVFLVHLFPYTRLWALQFAHLCFSASLCLPFSGGQGGDKTKILVCTQLGEGWNPWDKLPSWKCSLSWNLHTFLLVLQPQRLKFFLLLEDLGGTLCLLPTLFLKSSFPWFASRRQGANEQAPGGFKLLLLTARPWALGCIFSCTRNNYQRIKKQIGLEWGMHRNNLESCHWEHASGGPVAVARTADLPLHMCGTHENLAGSPENSVSGMQICVLGKECLSKPYLFIFYLWCKRRCRNYQWGGGRWISLHLTPTFIHL